jgi:biopolymer transport protein ExbB/TolQ
MDVTHSVATTLSDNHDLNNTNIVNIHDARPKTDAERQAERYKRKRDQITAEEKAKKAEYNRRYRLQKQENNTDCDSVTDIKKLKKAEYNRQYRLRKKLTTLITFLKTITCSFFGE